MNGVVRIFALSIENTEPWHTLLEGCELFEERLRCIERKPVRERIPRIRPEAFVTQNRKACIGCVNRNYILFTERAGVLVIVTIITKCNTALLSALGTVHGGGKHYFFATEHRRQFFQEQEIVLGDGEISGTCDALFFHRKH